MFSSLVAILTREWKWKLCALGFAVALWFYCMNVTGATMKTDVIAVLLTIQNEDTLSAENLVLQNESELKNRYIQLQVRGKREDIERLRRDTSKITAYIDLGLIEFWNSKQFGERQNIGVYVEKNPEFSGIEVINKTPPSVGITLDKYDKITPTVKVAPTGDPADQYQWTTEQSDPQTVEIWGARSTLSKISTVRVDVDISGATTDVTRTAAPTAYDVDGNPVDGIEYRPATVNAVVSIDKSGRLPILQPSYIGEPPEGFVITDVNWEPKYAEVVGPEEAIDNMGSISLNPVDVSAWTATTAVPYDLWAYLPDGLQLKNGSSQEAIVTFTLERLLEKQLTIPLSAVNIKGYTAGAIFTETEVTVTARAIQSVIASTESSDITGTLDLTGLAPGEHTLSLALALPNGVSLVGEPPVVHITITEPQPDAAEDEPQPDAAQPDEPDETDTTAPETDPVGTPFSTP